MQLVALLHGPARPAGLLAGGMFNLGATDDFRIPDLGYHRTPEMKLCMPSAALVIEVLSPGDETLTKLAFYARRGVEEAWVVDPAVRTVRMLALRDGALVEDERSTSMGLAPDDLVAGIDWP